MLFQCTITIAAALRVTHGPFHSGSGLEERAGFVHLLEDQFDRVDSGETIFDAHSTDGPRKGHANGRAAGAALIESDEDRRGAQHDAGDRQP